MGKKSDYYPPYKIGFQGGKQILTTRKKILDKFDQAKNYSKGHEIETHHGKVAEAEFRDCLTNFLPKRYGVTSGYIVSLGAPEEEKLPHYDVIIYDQLESPILWVEDNPDNKRQGESRAIPAEHVRGVIEIKSTFGPKEVKKAIEHLLDLKSLFPENRINADLDRKKYLPTNFFNAIVFFNLYEKDKYRKSALKHMIPNDNLYGYFGGLILRGESPNENVSGEINLLQISNDDIKSNIGKSKTKISLLDNEPNSDSVNFYKDRYLLAQINWSDTSFNSFLFNILRLLDNRGLGSEYHQITFWDNI